MDAATGNERRLTVAGTCSYCDVVCNLLATKRWHGWGGGLQLSFCNKYSTSRCNGKSS